MKNKIFKIMGVGLALVIAFAMGASFLPANTPGGPTEAKAATLLWSALAPPGITGNVIVGNAEDVGPVAISPNFAEDNIVFAVINDLATPAPPVVYISSNGGHTWVPTTTTLGARGWNGIDLKVSPNFATDNTVFVVVQNLSGGPGTGRVYRSTNGGTSFGQLGVVTLGAGEIITGFDVAPNWDGSGTCVVVVADRAQNTVPAAAGTCVQIWGRGGVLSWTGITSGLAAPVDVSAIKYSPSYAIDSTILVVSSLAAAAPQLRCIVGGTWDSGIIATLVGAAGVTDVDWAATGVTTGILRADIAIPSDYQSTIPTLRRAYVSIVNEAFAAPATALPFDTGIYRITNVTAGTITSAAAQLALSNIDYSGTFGEGTLIGGLFGAAAQANVFRTTNPTSSVVDWYGVAGGANLPSGILVCAGKPTLIYTDNTTAWVAMSTDYANDSTVIVGTQGDESAFGISTNGAVSFNETGLIEGGNIALANLMDIELSRDYATDSTIFLTSDLNSATANDVQVWKTTNGGTYWDRCFVENWTAPLGVIGISNEFATDQVVYAGDQTGTEIYYSGNAGQSWSRRVCNINIQTIAVPDATTVYVGEAGGTGRISKSTNSGWTWPAALRKASGINATVMSLRVSESTLVAGGNAGTVRRSDDAGSTWSKVDGTINAAANIYVDFDGDTVYAADSTNGWLYRSEEGGAFMPLSRVAVARGNFAPALALDLLLTVDGTLYLLDPSVYLGPTILPAAVAVGTTSVYRCINPTAAEPTPGVTIQNVGVWSAVAGDLARNIDVVSAGSGNIIVITADPGATGTDTVIRTYSDTLSAGIPPPTLVSPTDGSILATGLTTRFTIEAIPGVTAYEVRYSTDPDVVSAFLTTTINAPGVTTAVATLAEGFTTYWKARATAPFRSPWSDIWSVNPQITAAVNAPTLVSPGTTALSTVDVALEPVLNWSAFKYATAYELQLARDADMTDFIADLALGNVTAWKCTTKLEYSTTYFYRVRAVLGASPAVSYSDWSNVVGFTTLAKPVPPTPPVVVEPTPPTPPAAEITPAWIYAIIAVGAVLVIVVIVLIVRTRRIP